VGSVFNGFKIASPEYSQKAGHKINGTDVNRLTLINGIFMIRRQNAVNVRKVNYGNNDDKRPYGAS
jgi:hypothetical protein